jgi:hypothetical protein
VPTTIAPSCPNSIPEEPADFSDGGSVSMNWSTPSLIHGSGRIACKHRAIPVFPELDPPLSTITSVATPPDYPGHGLDMATN